MAATGQYQAGFETNQTQISYGIETVWGTKPAVAFQAIRYMSATLALTKTRARPAEINITREVSQAVTTEQSVSGAINFALSYGTYDDFFQSLLQNEWTPGWLVTSAGTDISVTHGGGTAAFSSTLPGKFTNVVVGQHIHTTGWVAASLNSHLRVTSKADNQNFVTSSNLGAISETSVGTNVRIVNSGMLTNGVTFKSLFMQQKFSGGNYLRYSGAYVTRMTLSGGVGNFFTGSFDIIAKNEAKNTTGDASTGATLAAPANTVIDPVAGWVSIRWPSGTNITGSLDQFSFTIENTGAAAQFNLGGLVDAIGLLSGTLMGSGALRMYCANLDLYDKYQLETANELYVILRDAQLNAYVFTFHNANIFIRIPVTGPNTAVMLEVTFEANPFAGTGGTVAIDRLNTIG